MKSAIKKTSALALGALLSVTACSSTPQKGAQELVTDQPAGPAFLQSIPADSPYAFASLDAFPIDIYLEKYQSLGALYDKALDDYEKELDGEYVDEEMKILYSVLKEFKGKFNKEGFESLGFSASPRGATYGIGLLPVFRFDIADGAKIKALLDRVELATGSSSVIVKRGELEHRQYQIDEVIIPVNITDKEIVVGFTPTSISDLYLSIMLDEVVPTPNMAETHKLDELAKKFGFSKLGVGFVDLQIITQMLVGTAGGINQKVAEALEFTDADSTPVCQQESLSIAARFPAVVAGYDKFTSDHIQARVGLLMGDGIGTKLGALKTSIPAANQPAITNAAGSFGVGFDLGKLVEFARENSATIRNAPYSCPTFRELNEGAENFAQGAMMLPPAATQFQGFTVALQNIVMPTPGTAQVPAPNEAAGKTPAQDAQSTPPVTGGMAAPTASVPSFEGVAIVSSKDSVALLDALRLFVPKLAELSLKPDAILQPLTAFDDLDELRPLFAAMTPTKIAVAASEQSSADLASLAQAPDEATALLEFRYNFGKMADILKNMDNGEEEEYEQYLDILGQGDAVWSVDPTEDGLFMTISQDLSTK